MKTFLRIFICLVVASLQFCTTWGITPGKGSDTLTLSSFPARIRGEYFNQDCSIKLLITKHAIYKTYDLSFTIHSNQLDPIVKIKDSFLVNTSTNEKLPFIRKSDSLVVHFFDPDTLCDLGNYQFLRKCGADYFLYIGTVEGPDKIIKMNYAKHVITLQIIYRKELLNPPSTDQPDQQVITLTLLPGNSSLKSFFDSYFREEMFYESK